jgi:AP-2 complex subunit alpha
VIAVAGDFVGAEVWHRVVQIVTNSKDLHAYAAERLFAALQAKRVHQTAVSVGGYILGEFGFFIAEQVQNCFVTTQHLFCSIVHKVAAVINNF